MNTRPYLNSEYHESNSWFYKPSQSRVLSTFWILDFWSKVNASEYSKKKKEGKRKRRRQREKGNGEEKKEINLRRNKRDNPFSLDVQFLTVSRSYMMTGTQWATWHQLYYQLQIGCKQIFTHMDLWKSSVLENNVFITAHYQTKQTFVYDSRTFGGNCHKD